MSFLCIKYSKNHGWDEDCNFTWSESIYPADVVSFLANTSSVISENDEDEEECDLEEDNVNDIWNEEEDQDLDDEQYI